MMDEFDDLDLVESTEPSVLPEPVVELEPEPEPVAVPDPEPPAVAETPATRPGYTVYDVTSPGQPRLRIRAKDEAEARAVYDAQLNLTPDDGRTYRYKPV